MYAIIQPGLSIEALTPLKVDVFEDEVDSLVGDWSLESQSDYDALMRFVKEPDAVEGRRSMEADGVWIRGVFETLLKDLVIDKRFIDKLSRFRIEFTIRNEDHINFFGGNLFGVDVVRFRQSDRDYIFNELLQTDEVIIKNALDKVPTINTSFIVTSDTLNNTLIWLTHKIRNTKGLTDKQRWQGQMDVILLMNYRFYTSLMYRYFQFAADPEIAKATYASLSRKFAIKQYGSWNAVFNHRAEEILSHNSIHRRVFDTMDSDLGVRYAISDIQGRIRSMCRLLTREHLAMVAAKERIVSESAVMEHDGEEILKDKVKSLRIYTEYLHSVISDERSFIKPQLFQIICEAMPTMPPHQLQATLDYLVLEAKKPNNEIIDKLINDTLIHAFGYLYQNRQMVRNMSDLAMILTKLRGTYTSSRNSEQNLLNLREFTEDLVKRATKNKHAGNIASVRTGVLLYIVARALTMKRYSQ